MGEVFRRGLSFFSRKKRGALQEFSKKLKPEEGSLFFLNIAQFFGGLNDNIFKQVLAFLLIDIKGRESASFITSLAGAIFVIPFILFSSTAGILADRFSKQRLLVGMKVVEIVIMSFAVVSFAFKSVFWSYFLLFLLATHSALFGPAKYAIISELVPKDRISRANGLITSFTYLSIILGTFLASFLTEITSKGFVIIACICLLIAVLGLLSAIRIEKTPSQNSSKKINFLFVREVFQTLRFCGQRRHLLLSMLGSAYFLFVGGYTQMNIIPFAISSLHLSAVAGGYLFLCTALGIALGAFLGGRISKKRIDLGLPAISGFCIGILLILLLVFSSTVMGTALILFFLGFFGGLFVVPFDSFVQAFSPDERRGQVIAANNFLSFFGVLVGAFMLFFYSSILSLSPAWGFALTGGVTLFLSWVLFGFLSEEALPLFARVFLTSFKTVSFSGEALEHKASFLVLHNPNWKRGLILSTRFQNLHFILPVGFQKRFFWLTGRFRSVHTVSAETFQGVVEKIFKDGGVPCLFLQKEEIFDELIHPSKKFTELFKSSPFDNIIHVRVENIATKLVVRYTDS